MKIQIKATQSRKNIKKWKDENILYDPMEFFLLIEDLDNMNDYDEFQNHFGMSLDEAKRDLENQIINTCRKRRSPTIYICDANWAQKGGRDGELIEIIELPKKEKRNLNKIVENFEKSKFVSTTKMEERTISIYENNEEKENKEKRMKRMLMERKLISDG